MLEIDTIYATRKAIREKLRDAGIKRTSNDAVDAIAGIVNSKIERHEIITMDVMNDFISNIATRSRKILLENSDRNTLMLRDVTTAIETKDHS